MKDRRQRVWAWFDSGDVLWKSTVGERYSDDWKWNIWYEIPYTS